MEKIIYNTKLKKILVGILVIMLLLYSMAPIAFSAVISFDARIFITHQGGIPEGEKDSDDWDLDFWLLTDEEVNGTGLFDRGLKGIWCNPNESGKYVGDQVDPAVIDQGVAKYNEKLREAYQTDPRLTLEEALNYAASEGASNIDNIRGEQGNVVVPVTDEGGNEADLGGILLSPVFYLINFIADAIISNLGNIMLGESGTIGTVTGTTVLQASPVSSIEGKSSYYTIEPDLDNVVGVVQYPNIRYTPEEIFAGKIDLLSIDFISGKNYEGNANQNSGWNSVRRVVAQWYKVLRMIAIIGLLSVLIYTGIKIIISANAKDKAKYKEWIINWVMAVAILFAMQLIMAFIISVTGEFSKLLNDASEGIRIGGIGNGTATNLMGYVRFMVQSEDFYKKVAYEVMYIALIVYTIKFTLVYLKRMLNMAFLTLIAPIVALTYPIDKINDGRAQGFDMWIKEYIFNALLQPMHQLLYYILVGSAISIAATNPIYGIVVLAFMTEAEKLLKKIFGFDKAGGGTVGGMAGAFAAGAVASSLSKMMKLPKGNAGKGSDGLPKNDMYDNPKPIGKGDNDDDVFDTARESVVPQMADAYDEKLGTDEYDSAERESMQREVNQPEGQDLYGDDLKNELINNQGMSEEEAEETMKAYGRGKSESSESPESSSETLPEPSSETSPDSEAMLQPSTTRQQNSQKSRLLKGWANVGKKVFKPVWDFDHKGKEGAKYNALRLAKKAGRAYLGASLGVAAAAVQAGISITDGKYNPAEGVATFAAGYAGGGKIAGGMGSLLDTYREGRDEGDKEAIMKRAQERWPNRDDVIKYNKKYKKEEMPDVLRIQKELLSQGVTDTKEMDRCIKYMKETNGGSLSGVTSNDIKKSRVLHDFDAELTGYGMQKAPYDADMRKKYIDSMTKGLSADEKVKRERLINNKFDELIKYRNANKP